MFNANSILKRRFSVSASHYAVSVTSYQLHSQSVNLDALYKQLTAVNIPHKISTPLRLSDVNKTTSQTHSNGRHHGGI
jgi:hypothetical protein